MAGAADVAASGARTGVRGADAFADAGALELGDRGEDVELQLADGRRGVDALGQRDERDPKRGQFVDKGHD